MVAHFDKPEGRTNRRGQTGSGSTGVLRHCNRHDLVERLRESIPLGAALTSTFAQLVATILPGPADEAAGPR
jgi:hypothetical protein